MNRIFKLFLLLRGIGQLLGRSRGVGATGRGRHAYHPLERRGMPAMAGRILRRFMRR